MKQIEPIQSWVNGQSVTATILNVRPIGGTLFVEAKFYYALLDNNLVMVAEGNIDMTGEAYQNWGNDDEYTYNWAASKDVLNLTIIGDYVPPVPEVVSEENLDSVI
jgi:hypothetical protein